MCQTRAMPCDKPLRGHGEKHLSWERASSWGKGSLMGDLGTSSVWRGKGWKEDSTCRDLPKCGSGVMGEQACLGTAVRCEYSKQ